MIPAISAKAWCICDGCGKESTPIETEFFGYDNTPVGWILIIPHHSFALDGQHLCDECLPTVTVRGKKLFPDAVDILGEDYFQ